MKEKKRKRSRKRILASILGFVMVVGITIVGTLAYMYALSNERKNTFTGSNDIKLYLDEPNYNIDEDGTLKWATQLDPREYIPGESYLKDPTLYNSTGIRYLKQDGKTVEYTEEWVAMRVDYSVFDTTENKDVAVTHKQLYTNTKGEGYFTGKAGLIEELEFDVTRTTTNANGENETIEGKWMKIESAMYTGETAIDWSTNPYEIYVYKYKLKANDKTTTVLSEMTPNEFKTYEEAISPSEAGTTEGGASKLTIKTSPLFEEVQLKSQDQLITNGYKIAELPQFNINLKGGAIKDMETITTEELVDPRTITGTDDTSIAKKQSCQKVINSLVELLGDKTTS